MEQMVSASLCGLPLAKASLAIGILHSIVFGGFFFYELTLAIADSAIIYSPPSYQIFLSLLVMTGFSSEALLSSVSGVCLVIGAWKSNQGFLLTWLIQQVTLVLSSLLTLFYYVVAVHLKAPLLNCLFELSINSFQVYFFVVVYSHFQQLRKGNLQEDKC